MNVAKGFFLGAKLRKRFLNGSGVGAKSPVLLSRPRLAISRMQMPWVAASAMAGGNIRVGLEDNLYLDRGVFASNGQLVERAMEILVRMGAKPIGPQEVRKRLNLRQPG